MSSLVVEYMNFKATVPKDEENSGCRRLLPAKEISSPSSDIKRASPLCEAEWRTFFNKDGRILNESALRKAIFKGTTNCYLMNIDRIWLW